MLLGGGEDMVLVNVSEGGEEASENKMLSEWMIDVRWRIVQICNQRF